jgi:uncharacterized protein YndB with AHSA1/START domain
MTKELIATASTTINAPVSKVWKALINPAMIKQFMFRTEVISDWKEGSPIVWKGEWQGKPYEDKGTIIKIEPEHLLICSHFSPLSGTPDIPENYHIVTYELSPFKGHTNLSLSQDNNAGEKEMQHSAKMWENMLAELKKLLEKK